MTDTDNSLVVSGEVWELGQHYTCDEYRSALRDVFDSVYYIDATQRYCVYGSYRMALRSIVSFAILNNIDEIEHIKSIRAILLESPDCIESDKVQFGNTTDSVSAKGKRNGVNNAPRSETKEIIREKFNRFNRKRYSLSHNGKVL